MVIGPALLTVLGWSYRAGSVDAIERKLVSTRAGRALLGNKKDKSKSIFAHAGRLVKRVLPVFGKACADGVSGMDPHGLAAGITMAGAAATGMSEVIMAKYYSPTRSWEKKMSLIPVNRIGGRQAPLELEAGPEALEEAAAAAAQKKPMELEDKEEVKSLCGGASTSKDTTSKEIPLSEAVYSIFCPIAARKAQDEAPQPIPASEGPNATQAPPLSEAVYSVFSPAVAHQEASQEQQSPIASEISPVLCPRLSDDLEAPSTPVQDTKAEIIVPETALKPAAEAASAAEEPLDTAVRRLEPEYPPLAAVAEPMEASEEVKEEAVAVQQEISMAGKEEDKVPEEEKAEEVAEQEEAAAPAAAAIAVAEEPNEDEPPAEGPVSPDQAPSSPLAQRAISSSSSSAEAAAPAEKEQDDHEETEAKRSSKELGPAIMIRRKNRGPGHVSPIKRIPFVPPPVPSEPEVVQKEAEPEPPVPSEPEVVQKEAKEEESAPSKAQLVKAEVSQAVSAANTALEMLKSKVDAYKTLVATVASPALKETKEGALQAVADVKVKVESCKAEVRDAVAEAEAAVSEAKSQVEAFKAAAEAGAASANEAGAIQSDVASAVEEADRLMKEAQAQIEAFKALTVAGDGIGSAAAAEEAKVSNVFS